MNAGRAHALKERLRHIDRSHAVVDHVDDDSFALLQYQQIGKSFTLLILIKDIGFEIDAVPGNRNGLCHFGHGQWPIEQKLNFIASDQRNTCGRLFQDGQCLAVQC